MAEFSRAKIVLMSVCIASAYVVWGLLISLMPPFYPTEAEKRGATSSQYGFVFGISSLAAFIFAPLFGRYGAKLGPKILYNSGAFIQALAGLGFGFLDYTQSPWLFIGLSYVFRAIGGIADVAAWGAVVGILMKVFPTQVARIMSYTQLCFGFGFMMGPALGAYLYGIGGFKLPFMVVGSIGIVVAVALIFVIPNVNQDETKTDDNVLAKRLTFTEIAKSPSIFMPLIDNFTASSGNSMLLSMLGPHLESVGANTNQIGLTFALRGLIYMMSSPLTGWVCDKIAYPSTVSVFGNVLLIISFVLVGPLPFVSLPPSYKLILISIAISAVGMANVMVSTFGRAQQAAGRIGYEKDMNTYLLISGMWTSSFYLGSFFGPTIAGFIVEATSFRDTTILFFAMLIVLFVVDIFELGYNVKNNRTTKNAEYHEIK